MSTSAQRFEQSNTRLGPISSNPLQALGAVGQFRPGPPSISRTNSSQGLSHQGGAIPQSPRARSQRSSSKRGNTGAGGVAMEKSESKQAEPKPILTIPASDVKPLIVSESRWKPRSVQAAASTGAAPGAISAVAPPVPTEDNRLTPEVVQRKVKAALNKMTPEKFDKISGQILDIASQSKYETDGRTLRQVIQLTFEKATDEAAWSSMYAKFCKVMMESMDPSIKDESIKDREGNVVTGGILFRKYLLNRCQEEFQRGWKVNLPPKPEGETDEAAMLSDEYYIAAAAKRRGLGLIQFIGELFKLGMLTERIMHECVKKLVDFEGVPEEAEVESLCKLLRTIGASLDATGKSRPAMDVYFVRIQTMIDHPKLQSRLKFMLMDVVDLRKKNWHANETDKGPKTLAEIQADVAKAAAEKEAASRANAQRGGRQGGGRGDNRNFSQVGYGQSDYRQIPQNTLNSDELRKLKSQQRDKNVTATQNTFGPPSMFASRGSNPKKMGPTSFNRGDDSGPASRTATPPSGATTSRNSFQ
ncbi:armadillo-type protein [Terfezia claveryi]|nr:armadillo-type protein [Terfezia claveryi]